MKRFIVTVLGVAVFFVGLGALADKVGAKFKSDEKALELVRKARQAIGGDNAIAAVKGLTIAGTTSRTMKMDGAERTETGETEIALQLPDKFMKMTRIGHDDGSGTGETLATKQIDVVVVGNDKDHMKVTVNGGAHGTATRLGTGTGVKTIVVKKDDGTTQEMTGEEADKWIAANHPESGTRAMIVKDDGGPVREIRGGDSVTLLARKPDGGTVTFTTRDGKTTIDGERRVMLDRVDGIAGHHEGMRQNEMFRTTLSLLLSAPQGMDVEYTYGGEGDVDGRSCNIVLAGFGGQSYKLYLDRISSLPVMISYSGLRMPQVLAFKTEEPTSSVAPKENVFFTRTDGPAGLTAEFQVKFSDYRPVGGVQLPYKWTQTVGGNVDETFDVTNYEINPANISDKFQEQKVMVRTAKPDGK